MLVGVSDGKLVARKSHGVRSYGVASPVAKDSSPHNILRLSAVTAIKGFATVSCDAELTTAVFPERPAGVLSMERVVYDLQLSILQPLHSKTARFWLNSLAFCRPMSNCQVLRTSSIYGDHPCIETLPLKRRTKPGECKLLINYAKN